MNATRILSLDELNEVLLGSRTKGAYENEVNKFFDSGEVYRDFTEVFPGKEEANLKNNIKKYAKAAKVPFQLVMHENGNEDGKAHVLLVNLDAHRLAMQANEQ